MKRNFENEEYLEARYGNKCFCGGGGGGASAPAPPSGGEYPHEFEEPGPSESEIALSEIALEKYDRFKEYYDPVEAKWLKEQDQDMSDYGAMMGYADAQQLAKAPAQINAASGQAAVGLAGLATAGAGGAASAKATAVAADFQRRNANKLWGLSAANKLAAANQGTLAGVAGAASNAAVRVASSAQGYQNRITAATNALAHEREVMKYNYQQGKIQNLASMGASLIGHYMGGATNQLGGGGFAGGFTNPLGSGAGSGINLSGPNHYSGPIGQWNQNNSWF